MQANDADVCSPATFAVLAAVDTIEQALHTHDTLFTE